MDQDRDDCSFSSAPVETSSNESAVLHKIDHVFSEPLSFPNQFTGPSLITGERTSGRFEPLSAPGSSLLMMQKEASADRQQKESKLVPDNAKESPESKVHAGDLMPSYAQSKPRSIQCQDYLKNTPPSHGFPEGRVHSGNLMLSHGGSLSRSIEGRERPGYHGPYMSRSLENRELSGSLHPTMSSLNLDDGYHSGYLQLGSGSIGQAPLARLASEDSSPASNSMMKSLFADGHLPRANQGQDDAWDLLYKQIECADSSAPIIADDIEHQLMNSSSSHFADAFKLDSIEEGALLGALSQEAIPEEQRSLTSSSDLKYDPLECKVRGGVSLDRRISLGRLSPGRNAFSENRPTGYPLSRASSLPAHHSTGIRKARSLFQQRSAISGQSTSCMEGLQVLQGSSSLGKLYKVKVKSLCSQSSGSDIPYHSTARQSHY